MPKSQFSTAYKTLLATLIAARKSAGMTQADLAKALGKPQPFISKLERGVRRVDLIEFCAISAALGIDPAKLFGSVVKQLPRHLEI